MLARIVIIVAAFALAHLADPRPLDGFAATETCNGIITPSCMTLRLCHQYEPCGADTYCCSVESTTYYYRDAQQ